MDPVASQGLIFPPGSHVAYWIDKEGQSSAWGYLIVIQNACKRMEMDPPTCSMFERYVAI